MKRLAITAALLCLVTPAIAFDADPASFRADPQAWTRRLMMPFCPKSNDAAERAILRSACECIARTLAEQITEADVAALRDDPDDIKISKEIWRAGQRCKR